MIISNQFIKPGKGHVFNRVQLRKLISGKVLEKNFQSGFSVEAADVIDISLIYIYNDNSFWFFMKNETFEQLTADIKTVGDNKKWLIEQVEFILTLWNNKPIIVTPPNCVELKVIDADPVSKGDTINPGYKQATLVTGVIVKVPLFVQIGDTIKVDTRSGKYISRIK